MPIKPASAKSRGAYSIAKRVFLAELSPSQGARKIHQQYGMKVNSAKDHIYVYRQMRHGKEFQRALSAPDVEYYLTRITSEDGELAGQVAVHALWQHIRYYEAVRKVRMKSLREIAVRRMREATPLMSADQSDMDFAKQIEAAMKRTPEERQKRLSAANRLPARKPIVVLGFVRNPDVVAQTLHRAGGKCEQCRKVAPFLRKKDKTPYLEVHHIIQLSAGGEDTVENALAVCPNCHRHAHFGEVVAGV